MSKITASGAGAPCWAPMTLLRACLTRPSRSPVATVLAPSHITVALRKLAAGSGRRKNHRLEVVPTPNGSLAAITSKSRTAGGDTLRVNLPWRSIVVELQRAAGVDMSEVGVSVSRLL